MRIVFALAWASVSPIALAINDVIYDLPDPTTLWVAEVTTILLVQLVAWPIWYWFHAKIVCDLDEASKIQLHQSAMQFGIFHLIAATTAVVRAQMAARDVVAINRS